MTRKKERLVSIQSISKPVGAVVNSVKNVLVSTAFRHRLAVTAVPVVIYAVNDVQDQFTSQGLDGAGLVVATVICTAIVNKLRGFVSA
jgi:hypothetical protein